MRVDESDDVAVCRVLSAGEVHELGQIPGASNDTRLITVADGGTTLRAVYKPVDGERPLHDFPDRTLARREVACYLLSHRLGLGVVPPTVLRRDLPAGAGSVQVYVEADGEAPERVGLFAPEDVPTGWAPILSAVTADDEEVVLAHAPDPELRRLAIFDVVTNNADRKASHIIVGHHVVDGRAPALFGIDNGLAFHEEPKLRTVLWGFAGSALLPSEAHALQALLDDRMSVSTELSGYLGRHERAALFDRVEALLAHGRMPGVPAGRTPIPWPPL